mmetsp:Transcript_3708/g.2431  ORF Transcript_3708/g.2431 Transcript_3708/m.2431 type:complete len:91 (+) Transcript_3708:650-922(+)
MTIGVADEARRLGLGSALIRLSMVTIKRLFPVCELVYLHVADYNKSAIRFYTQNDFTNMKTDKDHYLIHDKNYDAVLFYKAIDDEPQDNH